MRYSAVAALMILTTVLLSACAQDNMAQLEDRSGNFFGRNGNPSLAAKNALFTPSYETHFTPPASIDSVSSRDLTPAPAMAKGQPHSMSNISVAKPIATAWAWPVQGTVTAAFGKQREGIANEGITIEAPKGTPIRAAAGGEVAFVGNGLRDYGNMVILRHPNGDMSSYAHADRIVVAKGMSVKQGDTLGYVGETGRAKTPQLHFAVRSGDRAVDPLSKLPSQVASN